MIEPNSEKIKEFPSEGGGKENPIQTEILSDGDVIILRFPDKDLAIEKALDICEILDPGFHRNQSDYTEALERYELRPSGVYAVHVRRDFKNPGVYKLTIDNRNGRGDPEYRETIKKAAEEII